MVIAHAEREGKKCSDDRPVGLRAPHPPVKRSDKQSNEQPVKCVDLRNDRLRPEREAEGKKQPERRRDDRGQERGNLERRLRAAPPRHHPAQHTRSDQCGNPDRERPAESAEKIDLPSRVAERKQLEEPGKDCPKRIPRGMRHAKVLRRHDELTRVKEADVRLRRVKIDHPADQGGRQRSPPVSADEKWLPRFGVRRFGYLGHNKVKG